MTLVADNDERRRAPPDGRGDLAQRVTVLEQYCHPPFDFTPLLARVVELERQIRELNPGLLPAADPVSFIIAHRARITFMDIYANECSLQESALASKPALWLGANNCRMHLDRQLAAWLLLPLSHFVEHGRLPEVGS